MKNNSDVTDVAAVVAGHRHRRYRCVPTVRRGEEEKNDDSFVAIVCR